MRVAIVSRIFSPEPSAASFVLKALATRYRDAGHAVTVYTTTPPKGLDDPGLPGVRVKRCRALRDKHGYVRGYIPYMSFDIPLFFRLLFGRRADLYLVEPPPTTGTVVRLVGWLRRRPYVYRAADLWSDAARSTTSSQIVLRALRRVERFALRGAGHVFASTEGLLARMRELGIDTPATAIGPGIDTETFRFLPDRAPITAPFFLYAGTYSEWQGAGVFVEGFSQFSRSRPGFRVIFIGNGSERDALVQRRDELGLTDDIEFREAVPGTAANELLNDATASLVSLKPGEGYDYAFPTKVFASIAAGCPVLFSGEGPATSFIESRSTIATLGLAVPYDADSVARALARLADSPPSRRQRQDLSSWAHENHSLEAIANTVVTTSTTLAKRST